MLKHMHMITYNQIVNSCNSGDKFKGNSGVHVPTLFRIASASIFWNGWLLVAISIYKK